MAKLEEFLKTGLLGPARLGVSPTHILSVLGEPSEQSAKTNPLLLGYGNLKLTFWRKSNASSSLQEISIQLFGGFQFLPDGVRPSDFDLSGRPTLEHFHQFLTVIDCPAEENTQTSGETTLDFRSGVTSVFVDRILSNLTLKRKQAGEKPPPKIPPEKEPSEGQMFNMLDEAEIALQAGAYRASLLIAWAALEAALRRLAYANDLRGRIGVQPIIMSRELLALQQISLNEFDFINRIREIRTAAAHGLTPEYFDFGLIRDTIDLVKNLFYRSKSSSREFYTG